MPAYFSQEESTLSTRMLMLMGGSGLLGFEIMYWWLDEPRGPLWLRLGVAALCFSHLGLHRLPRFHPYLFPSAAIIACIVTAENIYRMYLVEFALAHSLPMLIVIAGCSYAFRQYTAMAVYLFCSAIGLTVTMYLTPQPQVPAAIYIGSCWVFCMLSLLVLGNRVREHNHVADQEQLLKGIFEGSVGGLLLIRGEDHSLILANDRAYEMLGVSAPDELTTRLIENISSHLDITPTQLMSQASAVEIWQEEVRFQISGVPVWIDVWMRKLELAGDRMTLIGMQDNTERHQATAALARSELFLELSQRIGQVGSWDINLQDGELNWSQEMFRIFDLHDTSQPTLTESYAYLGSAADEAQMAFQHAVDHDERVDLQLECHTDDKPPLWLRLAGEVVEHQGERHLLGIMQNVTKEKLAQSELVQARDVAEESLALRSAFLANMSHEIRTPMNGVIGMASLLMDAGLTAEQRELLETIQISGESLLRLINDILDFSKIDSGHIEFETRDFQLEDLFAGTLEPLAVQAAEKGVELTLEIDQNTPTLLSGDVTRVRQVVLNLVGNAVKFTQHGQVVIRVSSEAATYRATNLMITVTDTGIGIPHNAVEKLFEPFVQQDASTTRKFGGTGLGLSISKRLVEKMGGAISVSSQVGVGTTFQVHLTLAAKSTGNPVDSALAGRRVLVAEPYPASRAVIIDLLRHWGVEVIVIDPTHLDRSLDDKSINAVIIDAENRSQLPEQLDCRIVLLGQGSEGNHADASVTRPVRPTALARALEPDLHRSAAPTLAQAPINSQSGLKVLLAEDNRTNQLVASKALERLGCQVDIVENGLAAVASVQQTRYDLVLMDIQMPELDGLAATRRIRSLHDVEQPRVVALTANAMQEDRTKCLAAGMDDFLTKPITLDALAATLRCAAPN